MESSTDADADVVPLVVAISAGNRCVIESSDSPAMQEEIFGSQPMSHWYEIFNGVHVTFGAVRDPQDVVKDPQLRANDIVVPLEGAGDKLAATISSPIQVHGVTKVPARRAPGLGEHNEEILMELGFDAKEIDGFRASGVMTKPKETTHTA